MTARVPASTAVSGSPSSGVAARRSWRDGTPRRLLGRCGPIIRTARVEVYLAPGTSASILTQAANKAYRGSESVQRADFRTGEGAFLEYLPHHLIPYAGSSYHQQTTFYLVPDATLLTWDAHSPPDASSAVSASPSTPCAAGPSSSGTASRRR